MNIRHSSPTKLLPSSRSDRAPSHPSAAEAHVSASLCGDETQGGRDVLLARTECAEAYFFGGDSLALDVITACSLRLYPRVLSGEISKTELFDGLQECAANLGIASRDQDAVQAALAYGPDCYEQPISERKPWIVSDEEFEARVAQYNRERGAV